MNCKQGDLAIVVKSRAGNEGKIVRCLRLATTLEIDKYQFDKSLGAVWFTGMRLPTYFDGIFAPLAHDLCLRPIRDPGDDAQDETLKWLDVPSKETV